MTGHEIAENLRNSTVPWTTGALHRIVDGVNHYCVLGLKAHEAGATDKQLDNASLNDAPSGVWAINDGLHNTDPHHFQTKEDAIAGFNSPAYRDKNFCIEPWIEYVKSL